MPSQRFRFEQYKNLAKERGLQWDHKPFYNNKSWASLHQEGHLIEKALGLCKGFIKRFLILFDLRQYNFVFIHREAAPVGPPIFEWIVAKVLRKKIIYDFDDAIWVSAASDANPLVHYIKCSWKVKYICKWSYIVSAGNDFLAAYASKYSSHVQVVPTVVDTQLAHNRVKDQSTLPLTVGWTGTFTNFVQLDTIIPFIKKLQARHSFLLLIIADKDPLYTDVQYEFKKWEIQTEIDDLLRMHIGLMPLKNTVLEQGKCAFKAIQYMSLGIPPVVSDVGVNKEVVINGVNGYCVSSEMEWISQIEFLLTNTASRVQIGLTARETIIANYSVESSKDNFFSLFLK